MLACLTCLQNQKFFKDEAASRKKKIKLLIFTITIRKEADFHVSKTLKV